MREDDELFAGMPVRFCKCLISSEWITVRLSGSEVNMRSSLLPELWRSLADRFKNSEREIGAAQKRRGVLGNRCFVIKHTVSLFWRAGGISNWHDLFTWRKLEF